MRYFPLNANLKLACCICLMATAKMFGYASTASAQTAAYMLSTGDTAIDYGATIILATDSLVAFNNFIFAATHPSNNKYNIWRTHSTTSECRALFDDGFNRLHPVVSGDKKKMIYVKYAPQAAQSMHLQQMDSAWVCEADTNGKNEHVLFAVPEFQKNAIYALDWSTDGHKILMSLGNDAYPTLTRDGDIIEYDISSKQFSNRTDEWKLWNTFGRYTGNGSEFGYTHYANFWYQAPADVFLMPGNSPRRQLTNSQQYTEEFQFCTLTSVSKGNYIFRRGNDNSNLICSLRDGREGIISREPGSGGVCIQEGIIATTDLHHTIVLHTEGGKSHYLACSNIGTFRCDARYNPPFNIGLQLNWLGKSPTRYNWSTGDTTASIQVAPKQTTTYTCTVTTAGIRRTEQIEVFVREHPPVITNACGTLKTDGFLAYQWLLNEVVVAGATNASFATSEPGLYQVRVLGKKGNLLLSSPFEIKGPDETSDLEVSILPDPSSNIVAVRASKTVKVMVTDASGNVRFEQENAKTIDMDNYPDGSYDISVSANCITLKRKRIVKKSN